MTKSVILPMEAFKPSDKKMAVYKMWLGKYFYIGSTINLGDRIRKHINAFANGSNYKIFTDKYEKCESIRFEIVDTATDNESLRKREKELILKDFSNKFLLNSSTHTKIIVGFSNKKKFIKKINRDGSCVMFDSLVSAAKDAGLEPTNFKRNMALRYRMQAGEYMEVDAQGNEVPNTRKAPYPAGYVYKGRPHRPIIDLNTGIFWTGAEAIFVTGIHDKKLRKLISEEKINLRYA